MSWPVEVVTPFYKNHYNNNKMPDLFCWNQSVLMTRCRTDLHHQYGIFGSKSQTSFSRNATRARSDEGQLFSQAIMLVFELCFYKHYTWELHVTWMLQLGFLSKLYFMAYTDTERLEGGILCWNPVHVKNVIWTNLTMLSSCSYM